MQISLSTSYLQSSHNDGYAMLQDAAEMGFEYVELGHSTPTTALEGIMKALSEGVVKVTSLHAFCPVPPFAKGAAPNLFSPSTSSKLESIQWIRHIKSTFDFAAISGAKAVVCHCGFLSYFFRRPDAALAKFLSDNDGIAPKDNPIFDACRDKFMRRSAKRAMKKDYKYLRKNLSHVHSELLKHALMLGIENREAPAELPLDWNFPELFDTLSELPQVRVWHDVGHSKKKELCGLGAQMDLIEKTSEKICGWHLHDCTESGKDHIAIGKGCIDFKSISKFFDRQKHIFTLELNKKVSREDAIDSLKRVQDMLQ